MKLNTLRKKIDQVDKDILKLLKKRSDLVMEIGKLKQKKILKIEDKKREKQILDVQMRDGKEAGLDERYIKKLFTLIFNQSRKIQKKI